MALALTTCVKRKRVTETIVETVARRTVADVAVEQDTLGLVANKVSLGKHGKQTIFSSLNTVYFFKKHAYVLNRYLRIKCATILRYCSYRRSWISTCMWQLKPTGSLPRLHYLHWENERRKPRTVAAMKICFTFIFSSTICRKEFWRVNRKLVLEKYWQNCNDNQKKKIHFPISYLSSLV